MICMYVYSGRKLSSSSEKLSSHGASILRFTAFKSYWFVPLVSSAMAALKTPSGSPAMLAAARMKARI
jgi:hypothetical protein